MGDTDPDVHMSETKPPDSTVASDVADTVDLDPYADRILAKADKPLFREAVVAARANALRAAYIMIWLAGAESLKRRFRDAGQRDSTAAKLDGEISSKESAHKSVDKFVLDKAKEYGFLSDSAHTELSHVYEMRCLYGHPYEEAPSQEQVSHAAAAVVRHVLSKTVRLRHSYGGRLLESMTSDRTYLDDHAPAVEAFARDTVPRLDEIVHGWFLKKYWIALEEVADDPSMALFSRRGEWFSTAFLTNSGVGTLFSSDEWHGLMGEVPKTLARVCGKPQTFGQIGERAQDSLVGVVLSEATTRPSVLTRLEGLTACGKTHAAFGRRSIPAEPRRFAPLIVAFRSKYTRYSSLTRLVSRAPHRPRRSPGFHHRLLAEEKALSPRQDERFRAHVLSLDVSALRATRLKLATCFRRVISALKEHDWYVQNPAVVLVGSWGPEQVAQLSETEHVELGRNILQAAEGKANAASRFLVGMSTGASSWALGVVRGFLLGCFVNERREIRFKEKHLGCVLDGIGGLPDDSQKKIMDDVVTAIEQGTPSDWFDQEAFVESPEL